MLQVEVDEQKLLRDLRCKSYRDVADLHNCSPGKVWSVAVKHGARKNEARIQERARERRRRRREFLQEILNATHKADVLDFLDGLPDECVQLHATSLPYNIGKPYGGAPDVDRLQFHYYLGWVLQILSEFTRTLAPGGVLFLQVGNTRHDDGTRYPLDCLLFDHLRNMGLTFQDRIMWTFPHGLTPKRRLCERYEPALVFSKGAPRCFNANAARTPQKEPDKRAFKGPNRGRLSGNPLGAAPTNVWPITHVGSNNPERTGHPAQFPMELVRRAILLYTMPDDLVCDVFVGSGTTAAAAIQTGRSFTGCDLFYEDQRSRRLANLVPDQVFDFPGVTPQSVAIWQAEARPIRHGSHANPVPRQGGT